jgi:hypothetical protein
MVDPSNAELAAVYGVATDLAVLLGDQRAGGVARADLATRLTTFDEGHATADLRAAARAAGVAVAVR